MWPYNVQQECDSGAELCINVMCPYIVQESESVLYLYSISLCLVLYLHCICYIIQCTVSVLYLHCICTVSALYLYCICTVSALYLYCICSALAPPDPPPGGGVPDRKYLRHLTTFPKYLVPYALSLPYLCVLWRPEKRSGGSLTARASATLLVYSRVLGVPKPYPGPEV